LRVNGDEILMQRMGETAVENSGWNERGSSF